MCAEYKMHGNGNVLAKVKHATGSYANTETHLQTQTSVEKEIVRYLYEQSQI